MTYHIEICAPMGTGKTTLAAALKECGLIPIFEEFAKNPHLNDFYENFTPDSSYKKDLWFLENQEKELLAAKSSHDSFVYDTSLLLSRAYFEVGIGTPKDKERLTQKWRDIFNRVGAPDLLIVLDLPVSDQHKRIIKRGRTSEQAVPLSYIKELNAAVNKILKNLPDTQKTLHIDASQDFKDPDVIKQIGHQIKSVLG